MAPKCKATELTDYLISAIESFACQHRSPIYRGDCFDFQVRAPETFVPSLSPLHRRVHSFDKPARGHLQPARRVSLLIVLCASLFLALLFAAPAFAQTQPRVLDFSNSDDAKIATPYAAPGGVISGAVVSLQEGALDITNRAPGSFGVQLNITPLDVDQITDLTFDFKAAPDARVNWFFRANGNYYGVHFTGPAGVRPGAIALGEAEISPGKPGWKRAHIPLRAWLRAQLPDAKSILVDEILIGNWDNAGYLMAGIGGNGVGANWQMDDLKLEKRTETAKFGPARWEGQRFVLPATDLASFDFSGLQLQIEGLPPLENAQQLFQPGVGLVADIGANNAMALSDGQLLHWQLTRAQAPVAQAPVAEGTVTLRSTALGAPPLPTLLLDGEPVKAWQDFEFGAATPWQSDDRSAHVELDDSSAASGARSLRLTNKVTASAFEFGLGKTELDAAQFPVLTFAYRADDRVRSDLTFAWERKPYSIRFLDRDNPNARIATIGGVEADKQWHFARVDLLAALQKARPDATDFTLTNLEFRDAGWTGNARGVQLWLDDWRPAPVVGQTLQATVLNRDLSGLTGVSYVLDQKPNTTPDETTRSGADLAIPLEGKTGLWWLHVRARSGAGKWSAAAHFPFWCGALPVAPAPKTQ